MNQVTTWLQKLEDAIAKDFKALSQEIFDKQIVTLNDGAQIFPDHEGLPAAWTTEEHEAILAIGVALSKFAAVKRPETFCDVVIARNIVDVTPPSSDLDASAPGRVYTFTGRIVAPRLVAPVAESEG